MKEIEQLENAVIALAKRVEEGRLDGTLDEIYILLGYKALPTKKSKK